MLLNCSESSLITIKTASVQNIGKCDTIQTECNLNKNDRELINRCEGSSNCHIDGSLLTSACLWEDLYFDLSYKCKGKYGFQLLKGSL